MPKTAGVVGLCVILICNFSRAAPAAETGQGGYVGMARCVGCHAEAATGWLALRHSRYLLQPQFAGEHMGCETCHGAGEAHVKNAEAARADPSVRLDLAAIINPAKLPPAQGAALCLPCHEKILKPQDWHISAHAAQEVTCVNCHEVMKGTGQPHLLRQPVNDLCLSCHQSQRAEFRQNSHHPLREGRVTCVSCHDPMRGAHDALLKRDKEQLCESCHADKRGPFIFEHGPTSGSAADHCLTCHRPHGSPNTKLTNLSGRGLCLQCHTDINQEPNHRLRPGNCWQGGCHADIHGSQSNFFFLATSPRPQRKLQQRAGRTGGGGAYHPAFATSFQALGVEGNRSRFRQYHHPPEGFFFSHLGWVGQSGDGFRFMEFNWRNAFEDDQGGRARLDGLAPLAFLEYRFDRGRFFVDPSPTPTPNSQRTENRLAGHWNVAPNKPSLDLRVFNQRVDAPGIARLLGGSVNYGAREASLAAQVPVKGANLELQYQALAFDDFTAFLPSADTRTFSARYSLDTGARSGVSASYTTADTAQSGLAREATMRTWRLSGFVKPSPRFTADARLDFRRFSQPHTANTYVRQRDTALVRLKYLLSPRLSLRGGYERAKSERLNLLQTGVDEPRWETRWLSLQARLRRGGQLSAHYQERDLDRAAASLLPQVAPLPPPGSNLVATPLIFDQERRFALRFDQPLAPHLFGYLNVQRSDLHNNARQSRWRARTAEAGVFAELGPTLSANLDIAFQRFSSPTPNLAVDLLNLNLGRPLLSDGRTLSLSLSHTLSPTTRLEVSGLRHAAEGGADVRDQSFTLSLRRRVADEREVALSLSRERFRDRVTPGLNFRGSLVRLEWSGRF